MNGKLTEKLKQVTVQDRIRGSLIGGAAGDALAGKDRISDDTQMTMLTADGILRGTQAGLFFQNLSGPQIMMEGAQAAGMTHEHPMVDIPAGVLSYIIHRIVYGGEVDLYKIVREAQELIPQVFGENAMSERMVNFLGLAMLISRNESDEDWPNIARLGEGWVSDEALAIAVYCCLRYPHDFNQCLAAAVNHDGNSDSTGAIAGNILGALHGYEALEQKLGWRKQF